LKEVDYTLAREKEFVDEFFELKNGTGQVIPKDTLQYDLKLNHANEQFLKGLIKMPPTILPV